MSHEHVPRLRRVCRNRNEVARWARTEYLRGKKLHVTSGPAAHTEPGTRASSRCPIRCERRRGYPSIGRKLSEAYRFLHGPMKMNSSPCLGPGSLPTRTVAISHSCKGAHTLLLQSVLSRRQPVGEWRVPLNLEVDPAPRNASPPRSQASPTRDGASCLRRLVTVSGPCAEMTEPQTSGTTERSKRGHC